MRKEYIHLLLNINDTMIVFVIAVYMSLFLYICVVSLCCIVASRFCMFLSHFHTVTVFESLFVVVLLLATKLFIYHFNKEELNCIRSNLKFV